MFVLAEGFFYYSLAPLLSSPEAKTSFYAGQGQVKNTFLWGFDGLFKSHLI